MSSALYELDGLVSKESALVAEQTLATVQSGRVDMLKAFPD